LGATAPWGKRKKYLGQADDEVSIRHDAQITCPGEFCADGKRGAIERRNEDGAACVHLQEGRVQGV
jgi:hypothetical protein